MLEQEEKRGINVVEGINVDTENISSKLKTDKYEEPNLRKADEIEEEQNQAYEDHVETMFAANKVEMEATADKKERETEEMI